MSTPLNPKNLRNGDIMTVINKTGKAGGYDGNPMKFHGLSYPLIYVSVDVYSKSKYDYLTTYDLREVYVKSVPVSFLKEIEKRNVAKG